MKTVVFDIDGTLTDEVGFLKRHAPVWLKNKYGINALEKRPDAYKLTDIYGLKELFIKDGLGDVEAANKADFISQDFWNTFFLKYCREPLCNGVQDCINLFKQRGYDVYIVTMRGKKSKKEETIIDIFIRKNIVRFITKIQLRRAGIRENALIMPTTVMDKINYINALNPSYVFEDQSEIISQLIEGTGDNTKIVCISNPYNNNYDFPNKVHRVSECNEKELMDQVVAVRDSKENKNASSKKDKRGSTFVYRFSKLIGTPIVYGYYRPIICGKNLIPKEKSVAFVGNHRKKSDPIIIIAVARQIIHWAALQRMFIGGEDIFSSSKSKWRCNISASFLKLMGAVPIARPENEGYQKTNLDTVKYLTQQLKIKDSSIGFFPEGTLNRDYVNQDVLALKSNRIFRIVSMAKSFLQPFSVVWIPENSLIKNKVVVIFSNPINCEDRSNEDIAKAWIDAEKSSIQKINEIIDKISKLEAGAESIFVKRKKAKEEIIRLFDVLIF